MRTGHPVVWLHRPATRRRFINGLAGVSAALVLDPAALSRALAARTSTLPLELADLLDVGAVARGSASDSSRTVDSLEPSLNHLVWVWQFSQDGSKEAIRAVLARYGLGVVLKIHDGTDWMATYDSSADAVDGAARVAELGRFFEDGGVPFHAWCVLHGLDPTREAQMAAEVLSAGARSISLDLEPHAGFWRGTPAAALELGRELRRLQPDAWVVTSIDARPWEVDRIPLAEFATFASEIAPQAYWSLFQTPANIAKFTKAGYDPGDGGVTARFVLDVATDKLRPFGLPVRPIGDGTRAEESEWRDFIERAYENGAEAVSVWRFGVTDASVWQLLKETPPLPLSYVVQPGDTLSVLAEQWRTSVPTIAELNGIANANLIQIGARLRVPRGAVLPQTPVLYMIRPGDTLAAIAEDWGTSVPAIVELNGISNPNLLRVGQQLQIPRGFAASRPPVLYTVQPGDNLTAIAAAFDTTVDAIVSLNGITRPNLIPVGTQLRIP